MKIYVYLLVICARRTLLWRFLLTEGDPGCPGLGTALDPADADGLSRADVDEDGTCCWDTFCSSAASCLGSTPGERGGLSPIYLKVQISGLANTQQ